MTEGGTRGRGNGAPPGASQLPPDLARATLVAALEAFGVPAFVLDPGGRILHANAHGQALREADPRGLAEELARAITGPAGEYAVTPIRAPGTPGHLLAVQRARVEKPEARAAEAARRWGLTRRQREVLAEVARGRSNREIARALGCAESTVELHVTALLEKSGCQGRSQLVARFWTDP